MTLKYSIETCDLISNVRQGVNKLGEGPIMVHTNLLGVQKLCNNNCSLESHLNLIHQITAGRDVWFASFDDCWTTEKRFSALWTKSSVGVINEYFRINYSKWRTEVPLASFCGDGISPDFERTQLLDIYGEQSLFASLADTDGVILHYGSGFYDTTFIHYVEQILERPPYRFDKQFSGVIVEPNGHERNTSLLFHCRPLDRHMNYDWNKLEKELIAIGAVMKFESKSHRLLLISAKRMKDYCIYCLSSDPLYLLDGLSLRWVKPLLNKLGRRFQSKDFET